jgi:hypothetical protein
MRYVFLVGATLAVAACGHSPTEPHVVPVAKPLQCASDRALSLCYVADSAKIKP